MNPSPSLILSVLWAVSLAVEVPLVVLVLKQRRGWLAFLVYIGSHLAWSAALYPLAHIHHPALYFYSYWSGRAVLFVLECAAAGLIVSASLLCSSACAVGWLLANTVENYRAYRITRVVLAAERGLSTTEAIIILFLVAFASAQAFRWGRTELFCIAGFISQALATMASSALFLLVDKSHLLSVRVGLQIADIATLVVWIIAFVRFPRPNVPLRPFLVEIEGVLVNAVSDSNWPT